MFVCFVAQAYVAFPCFVALSHGMFMFACVVVQAFLAFVWFDA